MKLILIRHGATQGNTKKRYIGRTDEPLCILGTEQLEKLKESTLFAKLTDDLKNCDITLCVSPMVRCIQTAQTLFPKYTPDIVNDFRECDFGDFEGKNYSELNGNEDYQAWIDSGGTNAFPNGELPWKFKERCASAFERKICRMTDCGNKALILVVHGGTIMSILEKYEKSHEYYRWQCANGCGYISDCKFTAHEIKIEVTGELYA